MQGRCWLARSALRVHSLLGLPLLEHVRQYLWDFDFGSGALERGSCLFKVCLSENLPRSQTVINCIIMRTKLGILSELSLHPHTIDDVAPPRRRARHILLTLKVAGQLISVCLELQ